MKHVIGAAAEGWIIFSTVMGWVLQITWTIVSFWFVFWELNLGLLWRILLWLFLVEPIGAWLIAAGMTLLVAPAIVIDSLTEDTEPESTGSILNPR